MPNKPRIIRDREGWLKEGVEQLGLEQEHQNMEKKLGGKALAYLSIVQAYSSITSTLT